jgi:hypothetical protein
MLPNRDTEIETGMDDWTDPADIAMWLWATEASGDLLRRRLRVWCRAGRRRVRRW